MFTINTDRPKNLLPRLDEQLYSRNYQQYIPVSKLLKNYFRDRIHRLFQGQGNVAKTETGLDVDNFSGASGMSFMLLRQPFDWLKL